MSFLCRLNLHSWKRAEWSDRICRRCALHERLMYMAGIGAHWERIE
mgnify:CR=1 FL=1